MRKTIFTILTLLLLSACARELEKPNWNTDMAVPILKTTLSVNDLMQDSNIISGNSDSLFIIYGQELPKLQLDTLINLNIKPFNEILKLDSISNISFTDSFKMESPSALVPHGTCVPGNNPVWALLPDELPFSDTFNLGEYFSSISLKEGTIDMVIKNEWPVELKDVDYEIINLSDNQQIVSGTIATLPKNDTYSESFNLTNKKIDQDVAFNVSIALNPGPNDTFCIDTTKSLYTTLELYNLKIDSANISSGQTFINHTEETALDNMNDVELKKAIVKNGTIELSVNGSPRESTSYDFIIPCAVKDGNVFQKKIVLPGGTSGSNVVKNFDISGYNIDFSGINKNGINQFYYTIKGKTNEQVQLFNTDSIDVSISIEGLNPEYLRGYLGNTVFNTGTDTIDFMDINTLVADSLQLSGTQLSLSAINFTGIPSELNINNIEAIKSTSSESRTLKLDNLPLPMKILPAADLLPIQSTFNRLQITDKNSNPSEIINLFPDKLAYSLNIETNPDGNDNKYNNFIYTDTTINPSFNLEVPLQLEFENMLLSDTLFTGQTTNDEGTNVDEATIYIQADNMFPLETYIEIIILSEYDYETLRLSPKSPVEAAEIDSESGKVEKSKKSVIELNLDYHEFFSLVRAYNAIFNVSFSTHPKNKKIQFYDYYNMKISITSDISVNVKSYD